MRRPRSRCAGPVVDALPEGRAEEGGGGGGGEGLGFRDVKGLGGLGFRDVKGLGFRVWGLGI